MATPKKPPISERQERAVERAPDRRAGCRSDRGRRPRSSSEEAEAVVADRRARPCRRSRQRMKARSSRIRQAATALRQRAEGAVGEDVPADGGWRRDRRIRASGGTVLVLRCHDGSLDARGGLLHRADHALRQRDVAHLRAHLLALGEAVVRPARAAPRPSSDPRSSCRTAARCRSRSGRRLRPSGSGSQARRSAGSLTPASAASPPLPLGADELAGLVLEHGHRRAWRLGEARTRCSRSRRASA